MRCRFQRFLKLAQPTERASYTFHCSHNKCFPITIRTWTTLAKYLNSSNFNENSLINELTIIIFDTVIVVARNSNETSWISRSISIHSMHYHLSPHRIPLYASTTFMSAASNRWQRCSHRYCAANHLIKWQTTSRLSFHFAADESHTVNSSRWVSGNVSCCLPYVRHFRACYTTKFLIL